MHELTNQERTAIKDGMISLFNEYGYQYTDRAVDKIIDTWAENKGALIDLFKRHPKYLDGKFMIVFDYKFTRKMHERGVRNFLHWISKQCVRNAEISENLPADILTYCKARAIWLPKSMFDFFNPYDTDLLEKLTGKLINQDLCDYINHCFPFANAKRGMKLSRIINQICTYLGHDKHPDYNKEFAKFSDSVNPTEITRHLIVSINPLDYLTMSFGNSWASCHTIDKANKRHMPNNYSGCYSSGTVSYMLDSSSLVLYTVDSSFTGTDYYTQDKIIRQMYHYGNEKLVQGRLYPQSSDGDSDEYTVLRDAVLGIFAECLGVPNLWRTTSVDSRYTDSEGTHYRDYLHFSSCTLSFLQDSTNKSAVQIGHDPICIECGYEHTNEECINCCNEPCKHICYECGAEIYDSDDAYCVDGHYYCRDCVEYCDCCDEYRLARHVVYLDNYDRRVCADCLEERFFRCDRCGEYTRNRYRHDTDDGYTLCPDCYDEYMDEQAEQKESED